MLFSSLSIAATSTFPRLFLLFSPSESFLSLPPEKEGELGKKSFSFLFLLLRTYTRAGYTQMFSLETGDNADCNCEGDNFGVFPHPISA